jgi:hypothetical protein
MKTKLLIITVITTMMIISIPPIFASSLVVNIDPYEEQIKPSFQFQKSVIILYDETGKIREEMHGKDIQIYFSENSSNPQVFDLMQKLNQNLEYLSSQAKITELDVTIKARMKGQNLNGLFDYEITLVPTITNFVINKTHSDSTRIIDVNWRGMSIQDEIIIASDLGTIDINHPISFIKQVHPEFYEAIQGTAIYPIMSKPMIDSAGLNEKLGNWRFLFIPWSNEQKSNIVPEEWAGSNVSVFQKGDFSMRDGGRIEINDIDVIADKTYPVRIVENYDRGFIKIKGFASVDFLEGDEVLTTTPEPPITSPIEEQDPTWIIFLIIGIITSSLVLMAFYLNRVRK